MKDNLVPKDIYKETGYQQQLLRNENRLKDRYQSFLKTLDGYTLAHKKFNVIADVGAGNAELTDYFAKQLNANQAFAFDVYPTTDFQSPSKDSIVTYRQIKDLKIPLPNASVDLVMMLMFLHHVDLESKNKILKEVYRILKPDGIVFVREHDVYPNSTKLASYLDKIHENYNPDPLQHSIEKTYYIERKDLRKLFQEQNLEHLADSNYAPEFKNPQQVYHASFRKFDT